mgnify:CR=1 FL=1
MQVLLRCVQTLFVRIAAVGYIQILQVLSTRVRKVFKKKGKRLLCRIDIAAFFYQRG